MRQKKRGAAFPKRQALRTLRVLCGAGLIGMLFVVANIPAGALLGSIIGGSFANQRWGTWCSPVMFPRSIRVLAFVLIGCLAGVYLDRDSLTMLAKLAIPTVISVLFLLLINLGIVRLLVRRYKIDPTTALLATAPGGTGEIVGYAIELGARIDLIVTVHSVRILVIVLVLLPAMVYYIPQL